MHKFFKIFVQWAVKEKINPNQIYFSEKIGQVFEIFQLNQILFFDLIKNFNIK
jgi:hypothetical protein